MSNVSRRKLNLFGINLGVIIALWLAAYVPAYAEPGTSAQATTIYLVRHTEKAKDGTSDPALTLAGHARAAYLAEMVRDTKLHKVLSTDYKRTRSTAQPFADRADLTVELYDPKAFDVSAFAESVAGNNAVIVGHSNTIPSLVNSLLQENRFSDQDESDYDSFFIVSLHGTSANATRLYLPFPTPIDASE